MGTGPSPSSLILYGQKVSGLDLTDRKPYPKFEEAHLETILSYIVPGLGKNKNVIP